MGEVQIMPIFSQRSIKQLQTLHPDLQRLLNEAIEYVDFVVVEGHRGQEKQDKAFKEGKSQLKWPNSSHNTWPSKAVDIANYPVDYNKKHEFYFIQGLLLGLAAKLGIKIRLGIDFNHDGNLRNDSFVDSPHIELIV